MNANLGPLPEPDMSHEKARDDRDEETSYSAEAMEAERQRCYALGVAAERERFAQADAETMRLAGVALDESSGSAVVADWIVAALEVCRRVRGA